MESGLITCRLDGGGHAPMWKLTLALAGEPVEKLEDFALVAPAVAFARALAKSRGYRIVVEDHGPGLISLELRRDPSRQPYPDPPSPSLDK